MCVKWRFMTNKKLLRFLKSLADEPLHLRVLITLAIPECDGAKWPDWSGAILI